MVVKQHIPKLFLIIVSLFTIVLSSTLLFANEAGNIGGTEAGQTQGRSNSSSFVPGDAVKIATFPDTTFFLNGIFPIDDAGYVDLPIYGKTRITNMGPAELSTFLLQKYKDYLRFPNIQIKPMIRLSILGGVQRPGFYYFDRDYSLWEVVKKAGGTLDEDGLDDMKWKRDGDVVDDNIIPYLQSGVALKNISFRSGDQIWVKTPGKPGFLEKSRSWLSLGAATASFFTLYFSYQRLILDRNR